MKISKTFGNKTVEIENALDGKNNKYNVIFDENVTLTCTFEEFQDISDFIINSMNFIEEN